MNDEELLSAVVSFARAERREERARAQTTARIVRDLAAARGAPAKMERRRRWGQATAAVASLAVAASVLLGTGALRGSRALPPYELSLAGEQPLRSSPSGGHESAQGPFRFSGHEKLRATIRPQRAFDGRVGARVFLVRGEDVRLWPMPVDVSREGAIRIVTSLDTLPPDSTGNWEMAIVVGRPEALPDSPKVGDLKDGAAMHVLRARVEFALE